MAIIVGSNEAGRQADMALKQQLKAYLLITRMRQKESKLTGF